MPPEAITRCRRWPRFASLKGKVGSCSDDSVLVFQPILASLPRSMRFHTIIKRLEEAIKNPIEELSRWERFVLYTWKLVRQGVKQLSEDRASMMAASLTYRTLFGMLPMIVVGTAVAKWLLGKEEFAEYLHEGIAASGMNQFQLGTGDSGAIVTLGSWLSDIVSSGMNVDIATLTWIGFGVLAYSAITLIVDIETSFTSICGSNKGRAWAKRVPMYLLLFSFGPALLAGTLWIDSIASSIFSSTMPWEWLRWSVDKVWDFLLGWALLMLIYRVVPTIRMQMRAIMIGALVAAVLLLFGKESLGLYFNHAISLRQMYGSLGLVPIFMFWLYLMWLIILLGLQIASTVHQVTKSI